MTNSNLSSAIDSLTVANDISIDYDGYSDMDEMRSHISAAIMMIAKEQHARKREIRDFISTFCQPHTMSMFFGETTTELAAFNSGINYVKTCLEDYFLKDE